LQFWPQQQQSLGMLFGQDAIRSVFCQIDLCLVMKVVNSLKFSKVSKKLTVGH
jgi:hypothetical protein